MSAEYASGNIFIRENPLPKIGDRTAGHTHNFDHTTFVIKGAVHVKAICPDARVIERDFVAGQYFLVKADVLHEIIATQDDTLFLCVYAHRTPQGDIVQEYTGWDRAYV
jgi:quercetin dioxygenase-like cupin family protein